jgi:carbamoyl-phosphate synthase small subunit
MKRQLILEDGSYFIGEGIGSELERTGEVVFNTGMTGYQETISDPSYCAQIITFTYPLIGNYGINREDFESIKPSAVGVIVGEAADSPSHWQNENTLDSLLKAKHIPGIQGVDTRKLTRIIRKFGTLKGRICSLEVDREQVIQELKETQLITTQVAQVSTKDPYQLPGTGYRVVVVDFGLKKGILRELINRKFDVIVVPFNVKAEEIIRLNPDGVLLTNGPGDPKDVPEAIEMIQAIVGDIPIMGICLGHQLIALASGANTTKMKFGHRGANHPVKNLETGKVDMTSQNHGYTVELESLKQTELEVTHIAVNDGTVEGIKHKTLSVFSVQYHPEASPGPQDSNPLFEDFVKMIEKHKKAGNEVCLNV